MNKLQRDAQRANRQQRKLDDAIVEIKRIKAINLDLYEALKATLGLLKLNPHSMTDMVLITAIDIGDKALSKADS